MLRLAWYYFSWHYTTGVVDLLRNWRNFLWFFFHFFSIATLARTLFAPWRRLTTEYEKGFDPEQFFTTLAGNIIVRIVGALLKTIVIAIGLGVLALVVLLGAAFFLAWLAAPFLVILLFFVSVLFLAS